MMSPSAKLAAAAALVVVLITGAALLHKPVAPASPTRSAKVDSALASTDIRTAHVSARGATKIEAHHRTHTTATVTTGIRTLPVDPSPALPPLTGYTLDSFDARTTLPAGYRAEGLQLTRGVITLAPAAAATSDSRTGMLVSPALPLLRPSLAAPAAPRVTPPPGSNIMLEISLSEDGRSGWSPWALIQRYAAPDGRRVAPPLQAQLSPRQIASRLAETSATAAALPPGPAVRYRLTLTATGEQAPQVADIRIWKQEYQ